MWTKIIVVGAILLAIPAVALGFYWGFGGNGKNVELWGVVEIQEVRLGSKVGGRVEEANPLLEGRWADAGQVLVKIEVPELKAQYQQAQAQLASAQEQLRKMESMPRPEEVPSSEARVQAAQANLDLTEDQYKRAEKLFPDRAISEEDYRQRQLIYYQARAQLAQAKADEALLKAGAWMYDIDIALAAADQAEGKVRELEANLREAEVRAPEHVLVEVMGVRKGDLVTPNQPIVRVLRADDLWVKVYVPETELARFKLGQEATVKLDGMPNEEFTGTIRFIASESEFTPRNIQSADERRHQVFGMKIRIDNPKGHFKSGMAAQVIFKF